MATDANKPLRITAILNEVARSETPVTANEIAERCELPKATAYRLCEQLLAAGLIRRQIHGRGFVPGQDLIKLSMTVLSGRAVYSARHAVMQSVAREIGETCNLSVPDDRGMIYWDRVETEWPLRTQLPIGTRVPFHATAAGKLYLANLKMPQRNRLIGELELSALTEKTITDPDELREEAQTIARRGYSLDNEEFLLGMVAVAVPVNDSNSRMVAALAVHAPKVRMSIRAARQHVPTLVAAAKRIAEGIPEQAAASA